MEKAAGVTGKLEEMSPATTAKCVREDIVETLAYTTFPMRHWKNGRGRSRCQMLPFLRVDRSSFTAA